MVDIFLIFLNIFLIFFKSRGVVAIDRNDDPHFLVCPRAYTTNVGALSIYLEQDRKRF